MTDELLTLLDRVDPIDRERLRARPTPEEELAAILAEPSATASRPPRKPRPRVGRAVPAAATIAILIVAGAALLPGEDGGASPEAAQALESAAAVAAADRTPAGAGQYSYSKVRQVYLSTTGAFPLSGSYSYYMPTTIESWIAPDGSGRVRERQEPAEWPGPRDELRWRESGSDPLSWPVRTTDRRYGPGELDGPTYESGTPVRDLPTDPIELEEVFEDVDHGDKPLNVGMFEYGVSVLLQPASTPELRSATYEVLAEIEGVELVGETRDPLGRLGIEVGIELTHSGNPRSRASLIYDAETAHPLAYTERLLEPVQYIDGRLTSYTLLEESGVVESVDERPPRRRAPRATRAR